MIRQNQINVIRSEIRRNKHCIEVMHDDTELYKRFIDGCFKYVMEFEYFKELAQSREPYYKGRIEGLRFAAKTFGITLY